MDLAPNPLALLCARTGNDQSRQDFTAMNANRLGCQEGISLIVDKYCIVELASLSTRQKEFWKMSHGATAVDELIQGDNSDNGSSVH